MMVNNRVMCGARCCRTLMESGEYALKCPQVLKELTMRIGTSRVHRHMTRYGTLLRSQVFYAFRHKDELPVNQLGQKGNQCVSTVHLRFCLFLVVI